MGAAAVDAHANAAELRASVSLVSLPVAAQDPPAVSNADFVTVAATVVINRTPAFAIHFYFRARLKRMSTALVRWQQAARTQGRLRCCMRRVALTHRKVCLCTMFLHWAAFAAEQARQATRSSSVLQQDQLQRLNNVLQRCRMHFTKRVSCNRILLPFGAWQRFSSKQRRLKVCSSRIQTLRKKAFLSNWAASVLEHKHHVAESTSTALHEEQLRRTHQALVNCRTYFVDRLSLKDAASLTELAFKEWAQFVRWLRRASAVAKKFVFRFRNQCVARAFCTWAQAQRLRTRNLKLADLIKLSHSRAMHDSFVQWNNAVRIQKIMQQVRTCATNINITLLL